MESIWHYPIGKREQLSKNLDCDVAVIGAGMAGVLIAAALQAAGCRVTVLEANRIGSGQTRNTTAKVTAQHGLIYQKLMQTFGEEKARDYALANQDAIQRYRTVIQKRGIDCDWTECSAYLYGNHPAQLAAEAEAAAALGLPAAYTTALELPFPAAGAVEFTGQAQFHPLKFLGAMADGLTIWENTPVSTVEDHLVVTPHGAVRAGHIVFACHYPFRNFPGLYFARMHQERSYVLALTHAPQVNGMFLGAEENGISLRNYRNLLLLGGESHRTGKNGAGGRYDRLRQKALRWFPGSREVACWSAQDCIPADGVPYIGRYAASRPNWYVATGFQKWGMTSAMVSALILRGLICGPAYPYAGVFDPGRFSAEALGGIAAEGGQAVAGLTKCAFQVPAETAEHIPAGHGGIVRLAGRKVGVYKDEAGRLHPVEARCPHLGCQLAWNPDERSWECPCHGSRFDHLGNLLSGPAQESVCLPPEEGQRQQQP